MGQKLTLSRSVVLVRLVPLAGQSSLKSDGDHDSAIRNSGSSFAERSGQKH
jgi:hypothetical protein